MKKQYSYLSFFCLLAWFSTPFVLLNERLASFLDPFFFVFMIGFPFLGFVLALCGESGWRKQAGSMLNGAALCFFLVLFVLRSGMLASW